LIKSPEEFYQDGKKIGEVDVTVRGNFGLSTVFIGVECRDRPSDGPQGRKWIRELIGKRDDLSIDMMTAVSTTGFTSQAEGLAERFRINLITVEDINSFNPADWWETIYFSSINALVTIDGSPHIATACPLPGPLEVTPYTKFLRVSDSFDLLSIKEFFEPEVDKLSSVFVSNDEITEVKDTLKASRPVAIVMNDIEYNVTEFLIPVILQRRVHKAKAVLSVFKSSGKKDIVALNGVCEFVTNGRKVKAVLFAKKNIKENIVLGGEMSIRFLNENNAPDELMSLVGISFYSKDKLISSRKL
jgi:hypothetical protein